MKAGIIKTYIGLITLLACMSLLWSCAQIRGVSGGEKDVQPPVLTLVNPPDKNTGFSGNSISLTFDEFVQVNNLSQQLIISPPLKKLPKYSIRGKTVTLTFQEELMPNTTYVMQFGDAISDVHESNVLRGLSYVFSTGNVLDSLWVKGSVFNPWDGTPEKGARVMLFHPDSVAFTGKKPLYYGISDENGNFSLPHLREGNYALYSLMDESPNFIADEGERIAFSESLVQAGTDTAHSYKLISTLPMQQMPVSVNYSSDSTGMVSILWPRNLARPEIRSLITGDSLLSSRDMFQDSVHAWIATPPVSDWHPLEIRAEGNVLDTIEILHFPVSGLFTDLHAISGSVLPGDSLVLSSRDAISYANTEETRLFFDSTAYASSCWKITGDNRIAVKSEMPVNAKGRIIFPPGTITGPQGANQDSLMVVFETANPKDLGTLRVNIADTTFSNPMVMIMHESGKDWQLTALPPGGLLNFNDLRAGTYYLRLFDDFDGNQQWSKCQAAAKRQSEYLQTYPQKIQIRANWEVVIDWKP